MYKPRIGEFIEVCDKFHPTVINVMRQLYITFRVKNGDKKRQKVFKRLYYEVYLPLLKERENAAKIRFEQGDDKIQHSGDDGIGSSTETGSGCGTEQRQTTEGEKEKTEKKEVINGSDSEDKI